MPMYSMSLRFRTLAVVAMLCVCTAGVAAAQLHPETVAAWTAYVSATERRIGRELESPRGFLAVDFAEAAAAERREVLNGGVVVEKMETIDSQGRKIAVPSALVHHWRGEVLIPGTTVAQIVSQLQTGALSKTGGCAAVTRPRAGARPDEGLSQAAAQEIRHRRLQHGAPRHVRPLRRHARDEHEHRHEDRRVGNPETPEERELPVGDDRGFLWRLNAYWRYEEVPGGVIAECESISLSRDVPSVVRYLVNPLIESTARESMARTLRTLRAHFATSLPRVTQSGRPFSAAAARLALTWSSAFASACRARRQAAGNPVESS